MSMPILDSGLRLDFKRLKEKFSSEVLLSFNEYKGDLFVCIDKVHLKEVIRFLKEDEQLEYTYFSECLGVDYSRWSHERDFPDHRFEVVYHLRSLKYASTIFIKVGVNDGEKVPSLISIFLGAEYPEREVWDMFGIIFEGNEQTQRFIMPDDWVGHPLRKDFPLGGEEVVFDQETKGPSVEYLQVPFAGESFEGKTASRETRDFL